LCGRKKLCQQKPQQLIDFHINYNNTIIMALATHMNVTLQIWNGPKYSLLLRQDFKLTDFIMATNNAGICVEDYIFIARGKKVDINDENEFHSQKRLFGDTFIHATPKMVNDLKVS
jgi:hypothetical protein